MDWSESFVTSRARILYPIHNMELITIYKNWPNSFGPSYGIRKNKLWFNFPIELKRNVARIYYSSCYSCSTPSLPNALFRIPLFAPKPFVFLFHSNSINGLFAAYFPPLIFPSSVPSFCPLIPSPFPLHNCCCCFVQTSCPLKIKCVVINWSL